MVMPKSCQNTVQSVFQFCVALHLVFMDMREKVSQSLVGWSWFKRCLIGLPSVSLFLSVTMISTETSISEKPGRLKSCLTGCRECEYMILCSSETAREENEARKSLRHAVQLQDKHSALMCLMCPLMTTELLIKNAIVDLALCIHVLLRSPGLL